MTNEVTGAKTVSVDVNTLTDIRNTLENMRDYAMNMRDEDIDGDPDFARDYRQDLKYARELSGKIRDLITGAQ